MQLPCGREAWEVAVPRMMLRNERDVQDRLGQMRSGG